MTWIFIDLNLDADLIHECFEYFVAFVKPVDTGCEQPGLLLLQLGNPGLVPINDLQSLQSHSGQFGFCLLQSGNLLPESTVLPPVVTPGNGACAEEQYSDESPGGASPQETFPDEKSSASTGFPCYYYM